ncbi:DedA family protein [Cohnella sp. GCM10027633]|uniref:DedA family protein n=1 Tax=unclassified Cohnella TaxID=2636738 RepID=UPI003642518F
MAYDLLQNFIEQFGHLSLFLVLCMGIVGLPVPNEVIALTGGALSSAGILEPLPAFVSLYLGVCSGSTVGYSLGKFSARKLKIRLVRHARIDRFMAKAEALNVKYGSFAVSISCFFPLLRNVTPFVVGMNGMRYGKFAVYAYTTALVWASVYFIAGTYVGDRLNTIDSYISRYGYYSLGVLAAIAIGYAAYSRMSKRGSPPADSASSYTIDR